MAAISGQEIYKAMELAISSGNNRELAVWIREDGSICKVRRLDKNKHSFDKLFKLAVNNRNFVAAEMLFQRQNPYAPGFMILSFEDGVEELMTFLAVRAGAVSAPRFS